MPQWERGWFAKPSFRIAQPRIVKMLSRRRRSVKSRSVSGMSATGTSRELSCSVIAYCWQSRWSGRFSSQKATMDQEFRVKNAMNAICKLRSTSPKNCALPQNRLQPEGKCEMSLTLSTISPQQIEALDVEQLLDFVLAGVQAPQVCLTCSFQAE